LIKYVGNDIEDFCLGISNLNMGYMLYYPNNMMTLM